jgi:hypothetical protein
MWSEGWADLGLVVSFMARFTLKTSLLCIPGAAVVSTSFSACEPGRFPLALEAFQFVHPGVANVQT